MSIPKNDGNRPYRVIARDDKNRVRRAWRHKEKPISEKCKLSKDKPGDQWSAKFTKSEAKEARAKLEAKGFGVWTGTDKYPFVRLANGVFGNPKLSKRLNKLGRMRQKWVRAGSYKRPPKHSGNSSANCGSCQHCLHEIYLRGGNLAAACATFSGSHSHSRCDGACGSHHCKGEACDTSIYTKGFGNGASYVNVGNDSEARKIAKKVGLVLNVGGEPWHLVRKEVDSVWRA